MKNSSIKKYLFIGLMLFSLFFGAGNLIYPALLGVYSGENLLPAIFGFALTGVTLPLLGVVALGFSESTDAQELASPVSKVFAVIFTVSLYLAIGPFFAIPRTGATSYSVAITPFFGTSFLVKVIYALIFFGLTYYLAVRPNRLVDFLGKYLTPALLLIIAILVVASFINPAGPIADSYDAGTAVSDQFHTHPFVAGLIQGYGTMDALASLAFGIIVVNSAKQFGAKTSKEIALLSFKSGVVATGLLAIVYYFVARIGATSQSLFTYTDGQFQLNGAAIDGGNVLSQATIHLFGQGGQIILAAIIILACLSTSIGLISACASYFNRIVPKISQQNWALIFTLIAALLYFGGLSDIIKWSLPVLYLLYPLTIVLVLLSIYSGWKHLDPIVFQTTMLFAGIAGLYDALATLSSMTGLYQLPQTLTYFFTNIVPLGQFSLSWISFSLIGILCGVIMQKAVKQK